MATPRPIYFGGDGDAAEPYAGDIDLDELDHAEFQMIFAEWVTQCWIHDAEPSKNASELTTFKLEALIPAFRRAFREADWRRMLMGRGMKLSSERKIEEPRNENGRAAIERRWPHKRGSYSRQKQ